MLIGRSRAGAAGAHLDLRRATIHGCDLHGADLRETRLDESEIRETNARGVDLAGASLADASVLDGALEAAVLARARLVGASIDRTRMGGARGAGSDWSGAVVCGVDLSNADLEGAILGGATFVRCDLRGARLRGAVLDDAAFDACDLRGAELDAPETPASLAARAPTTPSAELLAAFGAALADVEDIAEIGSWRRKEVDDRTFGWLVADATFGALRNVFQSKDVSPELRRIASSRSQAVRTPEVLADATRLAFALRDEALRYAATEEAGIAAAMNAEAALFGALTLEFAPNLRATLAHAKRYLAATAHTGHRPAHAERVFAACHEKPGDGRIPYDQRRRALAYAAVGTHVGQTVDVLTERGEWMDLGREGDETRLRHHTGVELVIQCDGDQIRSRQILHDDPKDG